MPSINQFGQHIGYTVSGQFSVTRIDERTTQLGDRYKMINLADYTGSIRVYAWENGGLLEHIPTRTPAYVHANVHVRRFHGEVIANLQAMRELDAHEVDNAGALQSVEDCPPRAQPALVKMVQFVRNLQSETLRAFLNRVLLDSRVASGLVTCKGSQRHHHHERGGLLIHSVEVMEIATGMACNRLDPLELAITQVAALLHDLGKLRAVGSGTARPVHYLLASHESQTTRLLDPHLEWLRASSPEIAAGLDYTLGFLAQPISGRGRALFLAGDLVVAADRMSAALDNNKHLDDLLAKTLHRRRFSSLETNTSWRQDRPRSFATGQPHADTTLSKHETRAAHSPAKHQVSEIFL